MTILEALLGFSLFFWFALGCFWLWGDEQGYFRAGRRSQRRPSALPPSLHSGSCAQGRSSASRDARFPVQARLKVNTLSLENRRTFPRAVAAGRFILTRANEFRSLGGYERICSAVIEDVRVAELFKCSALRIFLAVGHGLLRTRMYSGVRKLWECLGRSAFEGAGYPVAKVLAGGGCGNGRDRSALGGRRRAFYRRRAAGPAAVS